MFGNNYFLKYKLSTLKCGFHLIESWQNSSVTVTSQQYGLNLMRLTNLENVLTTCTRILSAHISKDTLEALSIFISLNAVHSRWSIRQNKFQPSLLYISLFPYIYAKQNTSKVHTHFLEAQSVVFFYISSRILLWKQQ